MDAGDVLARIDPRLCIQCKAARGLCGIDPCPLLARVASHLPRVAVKGRDLFGSSPPSLFVGRHGYPDVSVGPMLPPEHREEADARLLDHPRRWLGMTIPDVVGLRSSLVRTTHKVRVHDARAPGDFLAGDRITRLSQELAMAARPVDTEVRLTRTPKWGLPTVGEFTAPHGPTVEVERGQLAENPRIERPVERAVSDTDLRAGEAMVSLYRGGTDLYHLERILSAGLLGLARTRKLVPTRWSITVADDQVGKALIAQVQDLPTVDRVTVSFAERFGNRFFILMLPQPWAFESVEAWMKGSFWSQAGGGPAEAGGSAIVEADWEDHRGRTAYATTAGGYYATRLSVLERLVAMRRQAAVVVLREITDAYTTPLGVWVVRETAAEATRAPALPFEDAASALRHIDRHALCKGWRSHTTLLGRLLVQRRLADFA